MAGLSGQYDPQAKLIQDQQAALPGQETAAISGLDTAKTNAFKSAVDGAAARGMAYSGAPIDEQNRYVGERYLPALAEVKQNIQRQGSSLQNALLDVRQRQGQQAQGIYSDQLNRDQQERQFQQQQAAQQRENDRVRAQQGLDMSNMMRSNPSRPQNIDMASVGRGLAKQRLEQLKQTYGNNLPTGLREAVLQELMQTGVGANDAKNIIYKEIFPDGWDGRNKGTAMIPWSPQYKESQQNLQNTLGYGGKF